MADGIVFVDCKEDLVVDMGELDKLGDCILEVDSQVPFRGQVHMDFTQFRNLGLEL